MAHEVFGVALTINTANFVYFLALQKVGMYFIFDDSAMNLIVIKL